MNTIPYICGRASYEVKRKESSAEIGEDWKLDDEPCPENSCGYKGVAYVNEKIKSVIIAHRGTKVQFIGNLVSDACLFLGHIPRSQYYALQFTAAICDDYPDYHKFITGHSLGGFHATMCGIALRDLHVGVVTFDSPGGGGLLKNRPSDLHREHFLHFKTAPNVINTAVPEFGVIHRLYVPHVEVVTLTLDELKTFAGLFERALRMAASFAGAEGGPIKGAIACVKDPEVQRAATSALNGIVRSVIDTDRSQHMLRNIIDTFHPTFGVPYLQREMHAWPSLKDLLSVRFDPKNCQPMLYSKEKVGAVIDEQHRNRRYEELIAKIEGYAPGDFRYLLPEGSDSRELRRFYRQRLRIFDQFYSDIDARQQLINSIPVGYRPMVDAMARDRDLRLMIASSSMGEPAVDRSAVDTALRIQLTRGVVSLLMQEVTGKGEHALMLIEKMGDTGVSRTIYSYNGWSSGWLAIGYAELEKIDVSEPAKLQEHCRQVTQRSSWRVRADKVQRLVDELESYHSHQKVLPRFTMRGMALWGEKVYNCITFLQMVLGMDGIGINAVNPWRRGLIHWPSYHIGKVGEVRGTGMAVAASTSSP